MDKSSSDSLKKPHGVFRSHCQTCGWFFQARNFNRHRKACLARKRKQSSGGAK
jgi:hypothetical protein